MYMVRAEPTDMDYEDHVTNCLFTYKPGGVTQQSVALSTGVWIRPGPKINSDHDKPSQHPVDLRIYKDGGLVPESSKSFTLVCDPVQVPGISREG